MRYIEFMLPLGEVGRATLELSYGASMIGGHPKLHEAAEKIVSSVRSIVPPAGIGIAPSVPLRRPAAVEIRPIVPTRAPIELAVTAPLPAPRLLPKVPFRFCIHADGDRHWMQLEGGSAELVPAAVRVIGPDENIIETRICIPLAAGDKGHAPALDNAAPAVAWVVVGIPNDVVVAIDAGKPSPFGFQAKVGDEWLSLDLLDTGCRLGRTQAKSAVS
jgi:hypothetical protein